jgi:hypothetical protein
MKIHGLTLVKDEADVIGDMLEAASKWADHIYVLDNGSTDGTWEIVQEKAKALAPVEAFGQDFRPYSNTLRHDLYRHYRHNAGPGDWWCKLDADEFYIDHPHRFLARVPSDYRQVFGASFQYYFTDRDWAEWEADPEGYERKPLRDRLRHYRNNYSEPRFVRHGRSDLWSAGHPRDTPAFPVRIWLAHYQYRSPRQIAARMRSRRAAGRESGSFRHERSQNWGKALGASARQDADLGETMWELRVVPAENLDYDAGDGRLVYREELLRKIPEPGLKSEAARLARRVPGHLRQRVDGLLNQRKQSRLAPRT